MNQLAEQKDKRMKNNKETILGLWDIKKQMRICSVFFQKERRENPPEIICGFLNTTLAV